MKMMKSTLLLLIATSCVVSPLTVTAQTPVLLRTFNNPAPTNTVVVSWPAAAPGFVLQQNPDGLSSVNWSNVTAGIQNNGTNKTLVVSPTNASRFYRLIGN